MMYQLSCCKVKGKAPVWLVWIVSVKLVTQAKMSSGRFMVASGVCSVPGSILIPTGALILVDLTPFLCPFMCPFWVLSESKQCFEIIFLVRLDHVEKFHAQTASRNIAFVGQPSLHGSIGVFGSCWGGQRWRLLCQPPRWTGCCTCRL